MHDGKLLSLRRQPKDHGKQADVTTETCGPDILMLSATAFRDLCATDEIYHVFCLTLGECHGLLGATTGGHHLEETVMVSYYFVECWTYKQEQQQ